MTTCQKCGVAFTSFDLRTSSTTNTPDGREIVRQHWHEACWQSHKAEREAETARENPPLDG